jgi:hypothetical protein
MAGFMLSRVPSPARPSGFIEACLPTPASAVPDGLPWAYEVKHDGFPRSACQGVSLPTHNEISHATNCHARCLDLPKVV